VRHVEPPGAIACFEVLSLLIPDDSARGVDHRARRSPAQIRGREDRSISEVLQCA